MSRLAVCRSLVVTFLALGVSSGSLAQERTQVAVHRACIAGGSGEKLFLRYWYPGVNDSIPEPVCVFKSPEFGGLPFRSAKITRDSRGRASVVVEFDEDARPLIERMTAQNIGKLVAIVVGDRIASMPMIWKAYSDNKLVIGAGNESDAERIVAVLNASLSAGSK